MAGKFADVASTVGNATVMIMPVIPSVIVPAHVGLKVGASVGVDLSRLACDWSEF